MVKSQVTEIRSLGMAKINRLVRAHAHLAELHIAFAEWSAGEIYVCKKTASYRYRFGDKSKSPAPWSAIAERLFESPAAFALAAMVLGKPVEKIEAAPAKPAAIKAPATERANIIQLAQVA